MFTIEEQRPIGWAVLNDYYMRPESAISAARRLAAKNKKAYRVVIFAADFCGDVIETIAYTPPAPAPPVDITALTKEIFG
jgi:hypothetical protein